MRALTWQGKRNVSVETVDDPELESPDDAIIEVTSTAICGSDLHLYEVLTPFMDKGDIIGHESMGKVVEPGADSQLSVGDRVVIPFTISFLLLQPEYSPFLLNAGEIKRGLRNSGRCAITGER